MSIMLLAMFNGIMTSIALETFILSAQMALNEAFRVAIGMSLISMISMEVAMNIVDVVLTGGAKLTLWVIIPMLVAVDSDAMALQLLETQEVRSSLPLGDVSCRTGKH